MRHTAAIMFLSAAIMASAQNPTLDSLVTNGNRAYELSQPTKIRHCADSIARILASEAMDSDSRKDYTVSMLKLYGNHHYEKASLDSAEHCYKEARRIISENPNTDFHGNALLVPLELAQLYYREGRYAEAAEAMQPVWEDMEYNDRYDSAEKLRYRMSYAMCLARLKRIDEALEIAEEELAAAPDKESLDYAKAQRMHAKILLLADADRKGALAAYRSYFAVQKRHARENFGGMNAKEREEYWQTLRPFIADCCLLEGADPGFLYDVTLFSKGLLLQLTRLSGDGNASESALRTLDCRWQDIQRRLAKTDVAIEFIEYGDGSSDRMAALVVKSAGKPRFIPLTPPDEVMTQAGKGISTTNRRDKDRLYSDSTLQRMVWTPELLDAVKGAGRIYFAPDGYLHRLAIEYMPQVENVDVCRLSSTRRLMEGKTTMSPDSPVLAFGAINYNLDRSESQPSANDSHAFNKYIGKYFPNLAESTDETKDILEERNNPKDTIATGAKASEYVFRQLAPRYPSILLSTHGDFCADSPVATDLKPVVADESMSSGVIAFSGVNANLRNPSFDASGNCDGLVSARELSDLDLTGCRLFTASACQSALGRISSDGVFGLQRGLKNAGVDAMLLSLWNVSSEATYMLMKSLYHNLNMGMPLRKAFSMARQKLLSDEPVETVGYVFDPATMAGREITVKGQPLNTPQYTDAFILIDAID